MIPCTVPSHGPARRSQGIRLNILMVLTSHAQLGDTGKATGF
jgi:hypothetical protein